MAGALGELALRVGADITPLVGNLKKGSKQVDSFSTQVGKSSKMLGGYAAAAVTAGAAITAALVVKGLASADAQAKLAHQLGGTVNGVKALDRTYRDFGLTSSDLDTTQRKLLKSLGEAQDGTGAAAEAIKKLGLNTSELVKMDADKRFAVTAEAIAGYGNAADKALISADLFGSRAGTKLSGLMGEVATAIGGARAEIDALGIGLSEVDAVKIEAANDSMDRFNDVMGGVAQQLAVQFAPILDGISVLLKETAIEAGGVGNAIGQAFDGFLDIAGFIADSVDSVGRVFSVVADGIIIAVAAMVLKVSEDLTQLLKIADYIPGVDLTQQLASIEGFASTTAGVIKAARDNIDETLNKPMPSETMKAWVAEVTAGADAAALAIVTAREGLAENTESADEQERSDDGMSDEEREEFRKGLVQKQFEEKLLVLEEQQKREEELAKSHQDALTAIEKGGQITRDQFQRLSATNQLRFVSGTLAATLAAVGQNNKKAAKMSRDLSLFQAAVSLPSSIIQAVKNAGGLPFGAFAGIATAAQGVAQIAAIKSKSLGGGSGATPSGGGSGGGSASSTGSASSGEVVESQNINITGIGAVDKIDPQALLGQLNSAIADGGTITGFS